jgi:cell division protein FtsL
MPRAATAAAKAEPRVAPAKPRPAKPRTARAAQARASQRRPARRRSGPAARPAAAVAATLGARVLPLPRRLELPRIATRGLLDGLMRGRVWVVLIGSLLVGIVFFQVSVLRLNQTITRDSAKATALRQENSRLGVEAARLSSSERIQRLAAARGFVLPVPYQVGYLTSNERRDAIRAAHRIVPPAPTFVPPPTLQVPQKPLTQAPTTTTMPPTGATGPATGAPAGGTQTGATGPAGGTQTGTPNTTGTAPTTTTIPTTTTGAPTGGVTSGGGAP